MDACAEIAALPKDSSACSRSATDSGSAESMKSGERSWTKPDPELVQVEREFNLPNLRLRERAGGRQQYIINSSGTYWKFCPSVVLTLAE
jgi:hypothetical protein